MHQKNKKKLNIVSIIPARGGSKGIVNKNIIDFCGKPLLLHTIESSLGSSFINTTYVTSDSQEILSLSAKNGCKTIRRPENLSCDYSTSESAIEHAIKNINENIDIVVFLQVNIAA